MVRLNMVLADLNAWGSEMGESIRQKLIPSWISFILQFAAFIVLLVIVIFVAYKPVKKMLRKRQEYIEQEISDAEKSKALAATNLSQSEERIIASKKEATQIIEDARDQAIKQKEMIILQAKQEAERIKLEAEKDIARSRQEALDDIHKEMVEVAMLTSSEILKREVNSKDNARLAKEFIENL